MEYNKFYGWMIDRWTGDLMFAQNRAKISVITKQKLIYEKIDIRLISWKNKCHIVRTLYIVYIYWGQINNLNVQHVKHVAVIWYDKEENNMA